jgi:MFS family permease
LLVSARALGAVAGGVLIARWVRTAPGSLWTSAWAIVSALAAGLLPLTGRAAEILVLLVLGGIASTGVMIYSQVLMTESTALEQRGLASGLTSQGWVLSLLLVPAAMGTVADRFGLPAAFHAIGISYLLLALAAPPLNRWAYAARPMRAA